MTYALTEEQQNIIDAIVSPKDQIIAVNAVAGSGKSSTCKAIVETYQPENGFYTAFNKGIITDSAKKFGNLIEAKTLHALAYKYVKLKKSIEEFNYNSFKNDDLEYEEKLEIIEMLDNFYRSSYVDLDVYITDHPTTDTIEEKVLEYADKMLKGEVNPTFNFMLKCLHLLLANKELEINFDLFLLDECQDVTPVTLAIFKLIHADCKVLLGDKYQNIYSFMHTVNAFNRLDNLNIFPLTQSFRCSTNVANTVQKYGKQHLENNFIFKGTDKVKSDKLPKVAYITRTNAMLIERMHNLLTSNQSFYTIRSIDEIFALPMALLNAANNKPVYDKRYKYLEKEYNKYTKENSNASRKMSFFDYIVEVTNDCSLECIIKMLTNFRNKNINIFSLKKKIAEIHPNKNIILSTAHAFKGLEADVIFIENDLNRAVTTAIKEKANYMTSDYDKIFDRISNQTPKFTVTRSLSDIQEDLNVYYVALSRAKSNIINMRYDN